MKYRFTRYYLWPMEFFRIIDQQQCESGIRTLLSLSELEDWCGYLVNIGSTSADRSDVGGIWGEFTLERHEIEGGLRFNLKECPNALAWTVTTGYQPAPNGVVIHLTLNRTTICNEFMLEVTEFIDDLQDRLSEMMRPVRHTELVSQA